MQDILENFWFYAFVCILMWIGGAALSNSMTNSSIIKDCKAVGVTRINDVAIKCELIKP